MLEARLRRPEQMKNEKPAEFIEPSLTDPQKHQSWLMWIVGFGPDEIEQRTGIPSGRIRVWACREKWTEQRKQYEELMKEKHPPQSQPIVQSVIRAKKGELRKTFLEHTGEMAVDDAKHWSGMDPQERLVVAPAIASLNGVHRKNLGLEDESESGEKSHISLHFLTQADSPGMVRLLDSSKVKEIEDSK